MGFIFGENTPWTYDQLQQKRKVAESLMAGMGDTPRNVGEGLNAIGKALAYRGLEKRAGKEEARMKSEADATWAAAFGGGAGGGYSGGGGGYSGGGSSAPVDPLDPTSISGDTLAALGKDAATAGYRESLVGTESGGNWKAQNGEVGAGGMAGHFGRVQFGKARLQEAMDAGAIPQGTTPEQFMNSPALQISAENWHFGDLESQLGDLVGATVGGKPMDMGALVAMGHLGGAGGARKYVESGGSYNPSDAYGTSLADYASTHGGQDGLTASAKGAPSGGGSGPQVSMETLMALAGNPMIMGSPEKKAVVDALIGQQLQGMDPKYQMEMEKAQLELAQLRDPQADPLAAIELEQAQLNLDQDKSGTGADAATYGTTLQFFTDPNTGKTRAGVLGSDGTLKEIQPPDGGDWASGIEKVDAGTKWLIYDKRTGEKIGEEPKDISGAAAQTAEGKALGEDAALLDSTESKMAGLETVIGELESLADEATYTYAGQARDWVGKQIGMDPGDGAVARSEYIAKVDNQVLPMLRDTFGSAFTVAEGETLRATLGDPNKSPEEKKVVLRAFIEQKKRDVDALRKRTGDAGAHAAGAGTPVGTIEDGYRYKGGDPSLPESWEAVQ